MASVRALENNHVLTTKQRTLRRFWHAIMPVAHLQDGPKPFRLMGEDIVLFLDADGRPAALRDRCCHRTAKLSIGWWVTNATSAGSIRIVPRAVPELIS